ncbi:MAG: flagellar biosynthesis anti-sigma factor FlgM [Armatimonadetes bacterium]|nr:flagellar biosynthesis anti-sigma factor FlgM [Armatimonadota bacterium]MCX7969089.1 flagellar biosynthesis anti-sigma factor FlgM [Armatimonadota bacterium]MDW8144298.1 flagellar biosynthesis anti-sigma factor FlgM [Armatimonadota bacterium]
MRISPETVAKLQALLTERLGKAEASGRTVAPTGELSRLEEPVVLSAELRLILLLHEMVQKMEEVDVQKVTEVAKKLQSGNYSPDSRAVAEAILNELGG